MTFTINFSPADLATAPREEKEITLGHDVTIPADLALYLLKVGVQCFEPKDLDKIVNVTIADFILASMKAAIDGAAEMEALEALHVRGLN